MVIVSTSAAEFNQQHTAQYQLCVAVQPHYVTFAIVSDETGVLHLEQHQHTGEQGQSLTLSQMLLYMYDESPLLHQEFRSTVISLELLDFACVPEKLYQHTQDPTLHFHLLKDSIDAGSHIRNDRIGQAPYRIMYPLTDRAYELLLRDFSSASIFHYITPLLHLFTIVSEHIPDRKVFAHFCDQSVMVSYFNGVQMEFCNHYSLRTAMDCLYFVLLVYHQFKLSPEKVPLILSGQLTKESRTYGLLYRYIQFVKLLDELPMTWPLPRLEKEEGYYHTQVLSLSLCAS